MPSKYKRSVNDYRNQPHSGKKSAPAGTDADLNLVTLAPLFIDEEKAREWLESKRWPDGIPYCPHCGEEGYALTAKPGSQHPCRPGLKKCKGCRKQFTVRIGTIFEESKLPISKWLAAFHLVTSSKKGISAHQMARELGITVKSAWFLCHRIRECMTKEPVAGMLRGEVEADESWVGGKPRHANNPNAAYPPKIGRGQIKTTKTPVMVLVERNGNSISFPVQHCDAPTLKDAVRKHVDPSATLLTDESTCYKGLGEEFVGGHHTVCHSRREYVRYVEGSGPTYVSSNTAESWFALLKRSFYGIHHLMSRKHLHRYCCERSFMWNNRKVSDGQRMVAAIEGAEGKRLFYRQPIGLE